MKNLLGHDVIDLCAYKADILVNLCLVLFIDLGQGEECHNSQDDQREAVEPGAKVRQAPQQAAKLEEESSSIVITVAVVTVAVIYVESKSKVKIL